MAIALLTISPAWADGGASRGGNAGGVDQASGPGGGGLPTTGGGSDGGSGGGAGESGGAGGNGSGTGGAGGATPGANGGGGGSATVSGGGGGGGGGGAHGEVISTPGTTLAPAIGGAGGGGGDTRVSGDPASGGSGGAGGWGASIIGGGSFTNTGSVSGGNGGSGGRGRNGGNGGNAGSGAGGSGGLGVGFAASGATFTNSGTISGGTGGAGGAGAVQISLGGVGGDGGAGLSGSGLTISNNGGIIGGDGGTSSLLGRAGNGGAGITGSSLTISNTSGILGGNGGASDRSSAGDGGAGITASGLMIFNSGSIAGGSGGAANVAALGNGNAGAGNAGIVGSGLTIMNSVTGTIIGGNGGAITVVSPQNGNAGAGSAGITGSGLTIINSGSIIGGRGGTANLGSAGAGSAGITGSGLTVINNGDIAGGTSGDGLTQASPITFTGGTNVLELQAQSNIAGNVVAFSAADTFRLGGTAAASFDVGQIGAKYQNFGVFEKTGTSTWTLTNTTAAATAWTVTGGLINFSSGGAFGTGPITLNGGGLQLATGTTIDISSRLAAIGSGGATFDTNGNNVAFATALTGAGGLTKTGSGTLTLGVVNSYGGGTAVSGGTLQLGVSNALASGSALVVGAGGTFNLNGFNQTVGAFSGSGTVRLGVGTLTVGSDNSSTIFAGVIGDSGGLTKVGSGTLTLTGINTLTGTTAVNGGTLVLNGSVGGNATVAAGATLMGTGTVGGNATIAGNIAPGNSIGTLNITGNYTQTGTYTVEVNGAGQSDLLNITGTATLTGGTVLVQATAGTFARNTTYTILTAAGGLGGTTYSGVTSNFAFLTPSLSYTANAVMLSLLSSANSFRNGAQTPNQRTVAAVLDQASPTATGDFNTVLNALYGLDTTQGPKALDAIGGQNYSGFSSLAIEGAQLFMDGFQMQAGGGASGGGGSASLPGRTYMTLKADDCDNACDVEPLWGAWGGGVGAFGTIAGDNNSHGLTYNLGGFAAGLDRKFGPGLRAGVATGFNAATLYTQGMPGTGTSNTLQFALYGEYAPGPFYLDALAGYGHSDDRMNRPIVIPGLPFRMAQGYTTANTFFGQLEAGYKIQLASSFGGFVTPFARLQASTSTQAGFTETGADSLNLAIAQQTTNSLRTVFGAQLGAAIDAPWHEKLDLVFRLGWSHEYADLNRPVTASFAGAPALTFTTFGASAPRDGALLGLGADTAIAERTHAYFRYDGDLAGANTVHVLSAGIRYIW